jgi:hypothetical protein
MTNFDCSAAELFPPRSRKPMYQRFGYRRFARATDAVRFAIEELPSELLIGAILEVDGERYDGEQIRRLYEGRGQIEAPRGATAEGPLGHR